MTALHATDRFKNSTAKNNLIARESTLKYGDDTHRPAHRVHVPGIANKAADALSRRDQPGKVFVLPYILREIKETVAPPRDKTYYLTKQ